MRTAYPAPGGLHTPWNAELTLLVRARDPAPVPSPDGRRCRCAGAPREPPRTRDEPVPAPACAQPGRLVHLGAGGPRARGVPGSSDLPVDRLRRLPLVPRDGARIV